MPKLICRIVIDGQVDFVTGSLANPLAQAVMPRLVREVQDSGDSLWFATMDMHGKDYLSTREGKFLPVPHCIRGTEGCKIMPELYSALTEKHATFIEKSDFAFDGWSEVLARVGRPIDEIHLYGFVSEICVISNAVALRMATQGTQTRIIVHSSLCAGLPNDPNDPSRGSSGHESAMTVLRALQCEVV